jgi:hypothetical protein
MESSFAAPVGRAGADDLEALVRCFYTTERLGAAGLSDGGGPFGFDVTVALQVEALIRAYACDGIVETGTFLGDTACYLARRWPQLPVRTIEIEPQTAAIAARRLRSLPNCQVIQGDSATLLSEALKGLERPLVYLDAHWQEAWPLVSELQSVTRGVVCVDDFDIGHPRFGFDVYGGVACDAQLIKSALPTLAELYVGNPLADYPLPCLQVGRRAGRAYLLRGLDARPLANSDWFVRVALDVARPAPPSWPQLGDAVEAALS